MVDEQPNAISEAERELLNHVREVSRRVTIRVRNVVGEFEVDIPGDPTDEYLPLPETQTPPGKPRV